MFSFFLVHSFDHLHTQIHELDAQVAAEAPGRVLLARAGGSPCMGDVIAPGMVLCNVAAPDGVSIELIQE